MTGFKRKKGFQPKSVHRIGYARWISAAGGSKFFKETDAKYLTFLLIHKSAKYVVRVSEPQITASVKLCNKVCYLAVNEWKGAKIYW